MCKKKLNRNGDFTHNLIVVVVFIAYSILTQQYGVLIIGGFLQTISWFSYQIGLHSSPLRFYTCNTPLSPFFIFSYQLKTPSALI